MMNSALWITVLIIVVRANVNNDIAEDHRSARQVNALPLMFPYGGTYKFIMGLGVPIKMRENINLGFAINIQYQFTEFQNVTELSQYYFIKTVSREQRDLQWNHRRDERLVFYKAVVNLLETNGMNGKDCMLRAICEAAQYPVEEEGLVGEIMHILLTPDYGRSSFDEDPDWMQDMAIFYDAAIAGRQMFSCPSIYSGCPEGQGFMEIVTILRDE